MEEDWEITAGELKRLLDSGTRINLIDVREPHEYEFCRINGSKLIPLGQIPARTAELNHDQEYVFYCHVGERSAWAVNFLRQLGFSNVKNLRGGIDAWATEVDPSIPRY